MRLWPGYHKLYFVACTSAADKDRATEREREREREKERERDGEIRLIGGG